MSNRELLEEVYVKLSIAIYMQNELEKVKLDIDSHYIQNDLDLKFLK